MIVMDTGSAAVAVEFDDFSEPARVPILGREFCLQIGVDDLRCRVDSDDSSTEGQHVHVVVFHCLVRRVVVMDDGRPDTGDLVRGDGPARTRSTNDDSPLALSCDHSSAHRCGEIGIVNWIFGVGADVDDDVTCPLEMADELLFEFEPSVIRSDHYPQCDSLVVIALQANAAFRCSVGQERGKTTTGTLGSRRVPFCGPEMHKNHNWNPGFASAGGGVSTDVLDSVVTFVRCPIRFSFVVALRSQEVLPWVGRRMPR